MKRSMRIRTHKLTRQQRAVQARLTKCRYKNCGEIVYPMDKGHFEEETLQTEFFVKRSIKYVRMAK